MCWWDRKSDKELISKAAFFAVKWGDGEREHSTLSLLELEGKEGRDSLKLKDREVDLGRNPGQATRTTKLPVCPLISLSAPVKHKSVITVHIRIQNTGHYLHTEGPEHLNKKI